MAIQVLIWMAVGLGVPMLAMRYAVARFRNKPDATVANLIAQRGVRMDGQRRRWTTFEPGLREEAARRRAEADERRREANGIVSRPTSSETATEHETVPFRRRRPH